MNSDITSTKITSTKKDLNSLLKHPKLWRARQLARQQPQSQQSVSTGFTELDTYLPGHGWPDAALVEVMMASAGVGELRLFAPALKTLSHSQGRWLAWINPPFIPYAPALHSLGIDISKVLLIKPDTHQDALWAVERACKSGTCSSVFAWLDERQLNFKDTQRLQIAAKQGGTLACLFRPQTRQTSMAELRLSIQGLSAGELQLAIIKRRGGWPINHITLPLEAVTSGQFAKPDDVHQQLTQWQHITRHRPTEPIAVADASSLHPFSREPSTSAPASPVHAPLH